MNEAAATPRKPASQALTGADAFWLRMDSPSNLMMINGVMLFDRSVDFERLRSLVESRLLSIPRFRQRVVRRAGGAGPGWEVDASFRLDHHVTRQRLPSPGDDGALKRFVSRRLSDPLDPDRPMWEFQLLDGYKTGCAVLCRFHHCIGDGIALMMVLLSLTDRTPEAPAIDNPFGAMFSDSAADLESVRSRTAEIMPEGMNLMIRPVEAWKSIRPWIKGAASTTAMGRLTFRPNDRRQLFRNRIGNPKCAAWSEALPLAEIKDASRALDSTLNDFLTAAVAGGIRRYMLASGHPRGARDFRATVPVNVRPLDAMADLGNQFGLVYLSMPVGTADPLERLAEVRRRMGKLKRSAEPFVVYRVLSLMGRLPEVVQRQLAGLFAAKASAVMTNVPGPRETLYVAGEAVRDLFFWVPQSGKLSLGISILSYAGNIRLGIATDEGLVPDPERIIEGFHAELNELQRLAAARAPTPSG